jgi:energy-coupling factor transporter ATP-binding protein EcfA2
MKILMLGHSGVGKTTFMACMYASLQADTGGFTVTTDSSTHERLMRMAKNVSKGIYPAPTAQMSGYDLALLHEGDEVVDFEWIDYRGGALNESGSHAEMAELKDVLESADGIIAFLDGPTLAAGGRAAREIVGRIMVLVQHAIAEDDRIIPIALVITKADLISSLKEVYKPLYPLGEAIAASRTVHGALILTACGRGVAENIEKPTLFVLHKGLLGALFRMREAFEAKNARAAQYESKAGFWDWIDSRLSGVPTYGDMAQSAYREANDMIDRYNSLVDPVNALSETLADIETF